MQFLVIKTSKRMFQIAKLVCVMNGSDIPCYTLEEEKYRTMTDAEVEIISRTHKSLEGKIK